MTSAHRRKMELLLARFVDAMTVWSFSKLTIRAYRDNVGFFLDWLDEETDVEDLAGVTPETLSSFQTWLFTAPKTRSRGPRRRSREKGAGPDTTGEKLAAASQGAKLSALKSFFRFLAREGKLLVDPAAGLTLPKRRKLLPQALIDPKEAIRLCESIETKTPMGLRNRAVVEVLYTTGIRNAELRSLTLSDFDSSAGTLSVRAGKGGKDRVVPLGPLASAVLSDYIAQGRPKLPVKPGVTHVFVSEHGWPLWTASVVRIVDQAARKAGLKKPVRPHRLRHACATHMLAGGADVRHIQRLLGHSTLATTEIYTRVEIGDLRAVHKRFHPRERTRG
jgi:integrase/recombinase XerD